MPIITMWINKKNLAIIDDFRKKNNLSRSEILYKGALYAIEEKEKKNNYIK